MHIWGSRMIEVLYAFYLMGSAISGNLPADSGVSAPVVAQTSQPLATTKNAAQESAASAFPEFMAAAGECAAFLRDADKSVFAARADERQVFDGDPMSVFFPAVGDGMRFVISANGQDVSALQCTGSGPATPDWQGFVGAELANLKPVMAQFGLVELDFPADPVLFADCRSPKPNTYFIFSASGVGSVVFAGITGAQAASFCGLYEAKE
jgi:hypothetical protein